MTNLVIGQEANSEIVSDEKPPYVADRVTRTPNIMKNKSTEAAMPPDIYAEMTPERIGARLRLLREAHGLTPSEIADMLGIERTYWSRFENGRRALNDTTAALLVSRFNVTLDFLILGKWAGLPLSVSEKLRSASNS